MTETIQRVERHIIRCDDERFAALDAVSFLSKNLYNATLYRLRQQLFATGKSLTYNQLAHDMLADPDYCALPRKVSQWVVRQVCSDWQSFWQAQRAYRSPPERFTARPRLPRYKHKTKGRNLLVYTEQAIGKPDLREGRITLSGLAVSVQTKVRQVDQVRVVPCASHYLVEVVYTNQLVPPAALDETRYAAVDVGVDVLAALTSNQPGFQPILVDGRCLKAINQFYNKRKAEWQSQLPQGVFSSRRLEALTFARNRRIDSVLHLASAFVIQVLVHDHIGTLVIGKNDGWKQAVNMGRVNNQHFVNIPHARFIDQLTYKAQGAGIKVILVEENHTSKCSFLDHEPIHHHDQYLGQRCKRGLFQASDGRLIQADLNASLNILRKAVPHAFPPDAKVATHGPRLRPQHMQKYLQTCKHNGVAGRIPNQPVSSAPGDNADPRTANPSLS